MIKIFTAVVFTFIACSFCGCKHVETFEDGSFVRPVVKTQFNDERYVWEYFIFTTNRVEEVK